MKITVQEIEAKSKAALIAHGAADMQAGHVARAVARAEALGNVICGLYYLESYCTQLASGRVSGTVYPIVSKPRLGAVKSDAQFGFAQPAFAAGLAPAVSTTRDNGIASYAISNAHTCTPLRYFTEQIAAHRLIPVRIPPTPQNYWTIFALINR